MIKGKKKYEKSVNFHENMKDRESCTDKEYMICMLLALLFMKIWRKEKGKNSGNLNNYSKNNYLLVELIIWLNIYIYIYI